MSLFSAGLFGPDIPDNLVDGFEDGDISEYSGSTGDFVVNQTSPVPNGSNRLERNESSATSSGISSTSGLNNYPERGDIFKFQVIPANSADQIGFLFFGTSISSTYEVFLNVISGDFELRDRDNFNTLDKDTSVSYTTGQEYAVEIDTSSGDDIACTLIDESDGSTVSSVSATDNTYNSTFIGWQDNISNSNTSGWVVDYLRITQAV